MEGYPRWSPNGKYIAFISTDRYDWVTVSYLYLIDVKTGEQEKITPSFDEKIKEFFWAHDGSRILFIAGDGVGTQIYSVNIAERRVEALTRGTNLHSALSVSRNGRSIAYVRQNAANPPDVYFGVLQPRRLTRLNPQIESWPEIETEVIRWKSFDGMTIRRIGPQTCRLRELPPISAARGSAWRSAFGDDQWFCQRRVSPVCSARLGRLPS